MPIWKKLIAALTVVFCVFLVAITLVYYPKFKTMETIVMVEEYQFYTMDYVSDYDLDGLLAKNLVDDQAFVDEAIKQIYPGLPISMEAPTLLCTVFAAESVDGERLVGRNYDLTETYALAVRTTPDDGYASIATVDMTIISAIPPLEVGEKAQLLLAPYAITDGINEMGVTAAALVVGGEEPTYQDTGKLPITTNLALRLILDKAASVDEAIELLAEYDMHASGGSSYHFFICDASGKSVVVEYPNNEMVVVESDVCTNFYLCDEGGEFEDESRAHERFEIASEMIAEQPLTEEEAMDVLAAAEMSYQYDGNTATQWSIVYNLDNLTATYAIDGNYDTTYTYNVLEALQ